MARHQITLGWRVNPIGDPVYWHTERPKPGSQADSDLVCIRPKALATHLAIIAQSGSGKSYFLGRLLEELLIHTRARCVILDPNADFRFVHSIEPPSLWTRARYDSESRTGKLPHEASRQVFARDWRRVHKRIRLGLHAIRHADAKVAGSPYAPLHILLRDLSADFLMDETEQYALRHEIYHCHDFIRQVAFLFEIQALASESEVDSLEQAEALFPRLRPLPREQQLSDLRQIVDIPSVSRSRRAAGAPPTMLPPLAGAQAATVRAKLLGHVVASAAQRAASALLYTSPETARTYFGLLRRQVDRGVLVTKTGVRDRGSEDASLTVIDLPSLPDRLTRRLVVNAVLASEWDRARKSWSVALQGEEKDDKRVPTFIVVDEAHNLVPAQTSSVAEAALREQFRIIAAEGRKYGLFLVLVSQRPDKLDHAVVSECENRAVMKLGAPSLIPLTRELLDLSEVPERVLMKCLDFALGRVLIAGRWAPDGPQVLMSAARRTREGGRNITDFWTTPDWELPQLVTKEKGKHAAET